MVLTRRPMPSISVTTSSPTLTLTTPSGVPVRITSPALQGHEAAQVFDQRRDVVDHVGGVALLRDLAVDQRAQRQGVRVDDEDAALAQHRVAGEARAGGDQGEMVGGVPGGRHRLERSEAHAVLELHVGVAAATGKRRRASVEQRPDRLGVVAVVVRERHPSKAAASVDCSQQALEVRFKQRAGVDHPRWPASHHPRVRARQGHRPGVGRQQAHDAAAVKRVLPRAHLLRPPLRVRW